MIVVHILLLHVALSNRPPPSTHTPFSLANTATPRPYNFWQWKSNKPYWQFLSYFTAALLILHVMLSPTAVFLPYTNLLGYVALAIEATLPLPQLLSNWKRRGCKGFRVSVIVNWIIGDSFKMWFFFASSTGEIPIAFKLCGIFQALCDLGLGLQYYVWGDGPETVGVDSSGRGKAALSPVQEESFAMSEKPYGVDVRGEPVAWERPSM
jgi:hypothetical protein